MSEEEELKNMLDKLTNIQTTIEKVMDITGASTRVNNIKKEISKFGWKYISEKYHPDVNIYDAGAMPLWEMYKLIYEKMKCDNEI